MSDLFLFTFKDHEHSNTIEITALSKSQAMKRAKQMFPGQVFRYVTHRPTTSNRKTKIQLSGVRTEPVPGQRLPGPKLVRKRKAFGRNDRCPCGSGKKVKYCVCSREKRRSSGDGS